MSTAVDLWQRVAAGSVARRQSAITAGNEMLEVHTLLRGADLLGYLYTIKSFLWFAQLPCAVFVHDDGSLTTGDRDLLQDQVPGISVLDSKATLNDSDRLADYPACRHFLNNNLFAQKLLGLLVAGQSQRLLLLDSDILFFKEPEELCTWVETTEPATLFNRDSSHGGSTVLSEDASGDLGGHKVYAFNAGLVATLRRLIDLELLERATDYLHQHVDPRRYWTFEQTLLALLVSRASYRALPPEYAFVNYQMAGGETSPAPAALISKHYSGGRETQFLEGIAYLLLHCEAFTPLETTQ